DAKPTFDSRMEWDASMPLAHGYAGFWARSAACIAWQAGARTSASRSRSLRARELRQLAPHDIRRLRHLGRQLPIAAPPHSPARAHRLVELGASQCDAVKVESASSGEGGIIASL